MTALERQAHLAMIRARAALVLDHPFFGSIALRLTLKPDPTCSDLWTDGLQSVLRSRIVRGRTHRSTGTRSHASGLCPSRPPRKTR